MPSEHMIQTHNVAIITNIISIKFNNLTNFMPSNNEHLQISLPHIEFVKIFIHTYGYITSRLQTIVLSFVN